VLLYHPAPEKERNKRAVGAYAISPPSNQLLMLQGWLTETKKRIVLWIIHSQLDTMGAIIQIGIVIVHKTNDA
jgi:hypothetical protein